jgi:hypothetical protein
LSQVAAAHNPVVAAQQTARSSTRWLALLVLLVIAGFGIAFAVAHATSNRTVEDPPHVVKVIARAKPVGRSAASMRVDAPGKLAGLVVSGAISNLASLPTYTYTQPVKPKPHPKPKVTVH